MVKYLIICMIFLIIGTSLLTYFLNNDKFESYANEPKENIIARGEEFEAQIKIGGKLSIQGGEYEQNIN